jgi:hypothetical protein
MNINIPTIQTLYVFTEGDDVRQFLGAFLEDDDEYHTVEHIVAHTAEFECEFDIPWENHHVQKIDNNNYEIQIWDEVKFPIPKPDRIIEAKVYNVLSFNGRHFKLGDEVEVD